LVSTSVVLVLIPVLGIGSLSLYQLRGFAHRTSANAYETLRSAAQVDLGGTVAAEASVLTGLIDRAETDARVLAGAATLETYLEAKEGHNALLNKVLQLEIARVVEGIVASCRVFGEQAGATLEAGAEISPALRQHVLGIKIGQSGYAFVMDSKGDLVLHPKTEFIGKNLIKDLNVTAFESICRDRRENELKQLNYTFEGRDKFVTYTWHPQWDWIICGSGYWDELSASAAADALQVFKSELASHSDQARVRTRGETFPFYAQIRLFDLGGRDVCELREGMFESDLNGTASADWFKSTSQLVRGSVHNSGIIVDEQSGQAAMRVTTPVHVNGVARGVLALYVDWTGPTSLLTERAVGKSGYMFLVNQDGLLVSHPRYQPTDKVDLTDAKFGALAEIARDKMMKGRKECVEYEFEGVNKYVAFIPVAFGETQYSLAAGVPTAEVLEVATGIQAQARAQQTKVARVLTGAAIVMVVVGTLAGWMVSSGIARPVRRIAAVLLEGSGNVSSVATQVSGASQMLANGASEQAAALEQTSATLQQMAASSMSNAERTRHASELSRSARVAAENGDRTVMQLNAAMNGINESSDKISKIIKVIEEIAFQTNLLALNAAVEAARAGEHGTGFAVVADEVRSLAHRAAEAAQETTTLIEDSVGRAKQGAGVSSEVGAVLTGIVRDVTEVTELIQAIARAGDEQAQSAGQLTLTVSQMDKVTQQSAAGAEEAASAAEELASQVAVVNGVVEQMAALVNGGKSASKAGLSQ
jgi:methyl-accepting chemotaxis protein